MTSWNGVLAPAGTPPGVISRLHATLMETLRTPAVREALARLAVDPLGNSPEEFAQSLRSELAKWNKVIKAAGVTLD
jgi:tripartite-type tricarboxylate transporter receptor subunit TctC